MKIITDTPTLFSPKEGKELGITVIPACTIIGEQVYRDYEDISMEELLRKMEEGAVVTTSQPSIGEILEVYQESSEELLVLPIGDGLSGTYQNMEGARNLMEDGGRIHVVDTKTLAAPQRYLVQKARKLLEAGQDILTIQEKLQESIQSSVSFVIPQDFEYLKRSGRLVPVAAKIVAMIKIYPIMTQTEDKKRITLFAIRRSEKKAVASIMERLKELRVDKDYLISVCHGGVPEKAKAALEQIQEQFAETEVEMFTLPPSLVTHGGPGCIVIQAIKK